MIDDPGIAKPATPSTQCYIECKSGAEFSIETKVTSGFKIPSIHDGLIFWVYIDGKLMQGKWHGARNLFDAGELTTIISSKLVPGKLNGQTQEKKFVFSPITKNDSTSKEEIEQDILLAKDLGTIRLVIETATSAGTAPWKPYNDTDQKSDFTEKALKGKAASHGTTLAGTTDVVPAPTCMSTKNKRLVGECFFHYRSYESLQHEMIIPRTPSPRPEANNREDDLSHLSESEIRQLALERLRETKSPRIKREANGSPHSPRTWKVVKLDDGKEAVDLTDE